MNDNSYPLREAVQSDATHLNGPLQKKLNLLLSFVQKAVRNPRCDPLRSRGWRDRHISPAAR